MKMFSGLKTKTKNPRQFIATRPALQEIQKDIIQAERRRLKILKSGMKEGT